MYFIYEYKPTHKIETLKNAINLQTNISTTVNSILAILFYINGRGIARFRFQTFF